MQHGTRARFGRAHGLAHRLALAAWIAVGAAMAAAGTAVVYAQGGQAERAVEGRVISASEVPIRSAIVYLSDTRTMGVQSYITQEDGAYRFEQVSPNDDYKLWAQVGGKKSKTKTLSSFDDRRMFHVILKIDGVK